MSVRGGREQQESISVGAGVSAEALAAETALETTTKRVREEVRAAVGLGRGDEPVASLRVALRESGASWYPLLALGSLGVVSQLQGYGLTVLGPEISRSLGIGAASLGVMIALKTVAVTLSALPFAALNQRRPRRALVALTTAVAWGVVTLFTGLVITAWALALILVVDGISTGSVQAVHTPLLVDSYPSKLRVRVLSAYATAHQAANILAPLIVGLCSAVLLLTWRGVFVASGVISVAGTLVAVRLRDPGFGRAEARVLREEGVSDEELDRSEDLRFFEIVRRLFMIPTIRRVLAAYAALGALLLPLLTYLFFFLSERWNMSPGQRALFYAGLAIVSAVALSWFGPRGERIFHQGGARLIRLASLVLAVGVAVLAAAVAVPVFAVMAALFAVAFAAIQLVNPMLNTITLSIVEPKIRAHTAALTGLFAAGVGGLGGLLLLSGVANSFGTGGAIASLLIPGVAAALILRSAAPLFDADMDRMLAAVAEREELAHLHRAHVAVPLVSCRGIDFSYGRVQVLHGVDFAVEDGEMVALLGTNGAGKSTLLRVLSGLGLPSAGTVRLDGADVTYVDAERRVRMGVLQMPGGRAVFPGLSVIENLRLVGHLYGRRRHLVERGIEVSLNAFPSLAERRNQDAVSLSGGEQQMLGLARAFILQPRLLLIDELSLGLSPVVVSRLIEMVKEINAAGTSVVLVEQSVNIALNLAEKAYFMEKGEIRFSGAAANLLDRADLLRSVFLAGAAREFAAPA